jgi:hypothetical protein
MSAALRAFDSRLPVDILIAKLQLKRMAAASV